MRDGIAWVVGYEWWQEGEVRMEDAGVFVEGTSQRYEAIFL